MIVDRPGVGESDIMDEIVLNYLPNAFAFIYVINISNAGGVQTDQVSKLLILSEMTTGKSFQLLTSARSIY